MSQRNLNLSFNIIFSSSFVIILDTSEDYWDKTRDIATKIVESFPGRIKNLYFWGNIKSYNIAIPRDFKENNSNWFDENKSRVSLITPIIEKLLRERFNGGIIIISSKIPLDLDDWQDTPIAEKIFFVKTSDNNFNCDYTVIDSKRSVEYITSLINNSVKSLCIKEEGFIPLCYEVKSKGRSEVIFDNGVFNLMIYPTEEKLECHIYALCEEELPLLYIKREKGEIEIVQPAEEKSWFQIPDWQPIPKEFLPIIDSGITKQEFNCPQCNKKHPYDTFICPQGDLILKGFPLSTCILFNKERYIPISGQWFAYPLNNNQSIITKDGKLFVRQNSKWNLQKKINQYEKIDDRIWAIFHQI